MPSRPGLANANRPDAAYQFSAKYGRLLDANSPDGHNAQLMRCGVIVLAYSLWEDQYRDKIADTHERRRSGGVVAQQLDHFAVGEARSNTRL